MFAVATRRGRILVSRSRPSLLVKVVIGARISNIKQMAFKLYREVSVDLNGATDISEKYNFHSPLSIVHRLINTCRKVDGRRDERNSPHQTTNDGQVHCIHT